MPLKNCKVELKLKWTEHFVLCAAGADNDNANPNNIIFSIKDTKLYVPVLTLSAKDNQKLSTLLSKRFERSVYWKEYKTKSVNKNTTNQYRYFLKSLIYLNRKNDVKQFNAQKYYLSKGIIKNYNIIINGKNFYDHAIDSDIKRYEEIRKLTTAQGEDYSTGFLLDYDYIRNHDKLITVDLSRQKELDAVPKAIQ